MIRVLIADDQEMVRTGLEMILQAADDIEVVASVPDGRTAVAAARATSPDVCLLDVRMPNLDGIAACAALTSDRRSTATQVVIVTTFDDESAVDAALAAGAAGFLLKTASASLVVEAVRAAASGDQMISPEITGPLLHRLSQSGRPTTPPIPEPIQALSAREEQVLLLVAEGATNAAIAADLHLSVATVKTHVNSLLNKVGARNRVELAAFAFRSGRLR